MNNDDPNVAQLFTTIKLEDDCQNLIAKNEKGVFKMKVLAGVVFVSMMANMIISFFVDPKWGAFVIFVGFSLGFVFGAYISKIHKFVKINNEVKSEFERLMKSRPADFAAQLDMARQLKAMEENSSTE